MTAVTVGFVGLGQMGTLMASRLVGGEHQLIVHDVRTEATAPLRDAGADVANSVEVLAAAADIVSVMVFDDDQVRDVVLRALPAARPGTVIAIHSTIRAETAVELAAHAEAAGVHVLDAPVSGGVAGASTGRLAVMVGGDRASYERCRDTFRHWAELVVHVGAVGAGTRAKVARNLVGFVSYCAAAEAERLAEAAGIELRKLAAVVRHTDAVTGGPGAILLRDTTAPLRADDPLRPVLEHTRTLGEKDLSLAVEVGRQLGVELPFAQLALERLAQSLRLSPEET